MFSFFYKRLAVFVLILMIFLGGAERIFANFPDVSEDHPNLSAIEYLKEHGVVSGYPDGTFWPDKDINRAESLKIILFGSGVEVPETVSEVHFPDFTPDDWYARFVETGRELGIVEGYPDGTFQGEKTVNLVEYLKMLLTANGIDVFSLYPEELTEDPFLDAPKNAWYSRYLQYAKDKNLVEASDDGFVSPGQPMTRGNFSEVMYRFMVIGEYGLEYFDAAYAEDAPVSEELDDLEKLLNTSDEETLISYEEYWEELGF